MSWDERELCSDPACTGVIGFDNRCKVCGAVASGERSTSRAPSADGSDNEADASDVDDERDDDDADADAAAEEPRHTVAISDKAYRQPPETWALRQLCPNGACIGVLAGGRCNICGKAAP